MLQLNFSIIVTNIRYQILILSTFVAAPKWRVAPINDCSTAPKIMAQSGVVICTILIGISQKSRSKISCKTCLFPAGRTRRGRRVLETTILVASSLLPHPRLHLFSKSLSQVTLAPTFVHPSPGLLYPSESTAHSHWSCFWSCLHPQMHMLKASIFSIWGTYMKPPLSSNI